ncbi:hypothetical protein OAJ77_03225 [Rhodospirillales bacterium]|nr:hypothetical protein [Rhodospirillales bacterium]
MENNRIKKEYSKKTIVEIGGAEFTIGVSKSTDNPDDQSLALKIVVYGMDSLETTENVLERLFQTLQDIDPELQLQESNKEKSALH